MVHQNHLLDNIQMVDISILLNDILETLWKLLIRNSMCKYTHYILMIAKYWW